MNAAFSIGLPGKRVGRKPGSSKRACQQARESSTAARRVHSGARTPSCPGDCAPGERDALTQLSGLRSCEFGGSPLPPRRGTQAATRRCRSIHVASVESGRVTLAIVNGAAAVACGDSLIGPSSSCAEPHGRRAGPSAAGRVAAVAMLDRYSQCSTCPSYLMQRGLPPVRLGADAAHVLPYPSRNHPSS